MLSLFVIFKSLWMVFWEHKTEFVCFFSITEILKLFLVQYRMVFENLNMKERVHLLTELRVGIDHVLKYDQFLFPFLILDKIKIIINEI